MFPRIHQPICRFAWHRLGFNGLSLYAATNQLAIIINPLDNVSRLMATRCLLTRQLQTCTRCSRSQPVLQQFNKPIGAFSKYNQLCIQQFNRRGVSYSRTPSKNLIIRIVCYFLLIFFVGFNYF